MPPTRSRRRGRLPSVHQVYGTSDFEIDWWYVKQVEIIDDDRSTRQRGLGLSEISMKDRRR
jgi:hypothetical protein